MSMQGTAENVLTAFQFSIEIDGVNRQTFTSVDGLAITVTSLETWGADADAKTFEQKVAGTTTYSDLSITANFTTESFIRDWRKEVVEGKYESYRRNGSIVMYNTELVEQARWNFTEAWPSSWTMGGLTAGTSQVLTESVTIAIESIERV